MAYLVKRSCGRCGRQLEAGHDYRAIGPPYLKCRFCGCINRVDHITEWDLMTFEKKFAHIMIHLWTCVLYGFSVPVAWLLLNLIQGNNEPSELHLLLSLLAGIAALSAYRTPQLIREIRLSRARMMISTYRAELQMIGCTCLPPLPNNMNNTSSR